MDWLAPLSAVVVVLLVSYLMVSIESHFKKDSQSDPGWGNGVPPCPPHKNSQPHDWEYDEGGKLFCTRCRRYAGID